MLSVIVNVMVFEDCRNQWSMSRPMLGLILLQEEYFAQLKMQVLQALPEPKQRIVDEYFTALMDGIERNLGVKNKDAFTQNLTVFKRDIQDILRGSAPITAGLPPQPSNSDMVS